MQRLFILMFCLACTIVGVVWGFNRWKLRRNGVRTMGTVVDISVSGITTEKAFYPVVEFKTDTGNKIRFRGTTGTAYSPSYQQGQLVKVIYSQQEPWNAKIDNFEQLWLGPVSIGLFGLIALGAFLSFG
ncbi:MAG: hypothetical protein CVV05_18445 [Gammaproteobacteria bacterium HGW-Gammaproteobacteria-1]|jgi:hypothetical protein|nr:MAG: hypothetical protein CVV05_18445 [Gammaproteobacteria bacterium HGW-Gammaproteobacteria-1]